MKTRRHPPTPSQAALAAARAAELRAAALALPTVPGGDWRGVRRRMATLRHLRTEADRLEAIARQAIPPEALVDLPF